MPRSRLIPSNKLDDKKPKIFIEINGGNVQQICCTLPSYIMVVDHDNLSAADSDPDILNIWEKSDIVTSDWMERKIKKIKLEYKDLHDSLDGEKV